MTIMLIRAPATFRQESLYRASPGSPSAVNVPAALRLLGRVDLGRLENALAVLIERHASLRTTLAEHDGSIVQQVSEATLFDVARPQVTRPRRHLTDVAEQAAEPFVLDGSPLARFDLYRIEPDQHVVCLTLHHAISDGASSTVLLRDLVALYAGDADALPVLRFSMAEVAARERGAPSASIAGYWAARLSGPGARPDLLRAHDVASFSPVVVRCRTISPPRLDALANLARDQQSPFSAVLIAALLVALPAEAAPLTLGVTFSNRDRAEVEPLVGYLADDLPVVINAEPRATFADLVGQAGRALADAQDHRVPSGLLRPLLNEGCGPLFPVTVNYQPSAGPVATRARGVLFEPVRLPEEPRVVTPMWSGASTLTLQLYRDDRGLSGTVLANGSAVGAPLAHHIADRCRLALVTISERAEGAIGPLAWSMRDLP
jgi:hypothetical protein